VGNVTTCARGCGFRYVRDNLSKLSPRQREVLRLLATGRSYSEVARDLGIGLDTVKGHVVSLYASLGAGTREEAYALVGWLVVPEDAA
jgi:DNA-binding CsgD family transcriptional regulator